MARRIKIFTEGTKLPVNGISKSRLLSLGEALCDALLLEKVNVSLVLTTNEGIRNINREYRKKDSATDVIAFAYREEPFPGDDKGDIEYLGDIYISLQRAEEQASEYGVTPEEEVKRLLIHGMLHLVGYDHERSSRDEKEMRAKEEELWDNVSL